METGYQTLESIDWSRLLHAYGLATDTPEHLRALLDGDPEKFEAAMKHLWSAILHQGTAWPATGPVARVLVGFFRDPLRDQDDSSRRATLLLFLANVLAVHEDSDAPKIEELERLAKFDFEELIDPDDEEMSDLYENDDATASLFARAVLDCVAAAPAIAETALRELSHRDPGVRSVAAMAASKLKHLNLAPLDLEKTLTTVARAAELTDERAALVMALGDLGASPADFLSDPSRAVRMCAALAPALAQDEAAIAELIRVLVEDVERIDAFFEERPPQFPMRPRFSVVAKLVERVKDFARLERAAIAVLRLPPPLTDYDWGPFLVHAFRDTGGKMETQAQRRFLAALVTRDDLWDPRNGNAGGRFREAGLKFDRAWCLNLVKS